jgi:hypothetical protein
MSGNTLVNALSPSVGAVLLLLIGAIVVSVTFCCKPCMGSLCSTKSDIGNPLSERYQTRNPHIPLHPAPAAPRQRQRVGRSVEDDDDAAELRRLLAEPEPGEAPVMATVMAPPTPLPRSGVGMGMETGRNNPYTRLSRSINNNL